MGISIEEKGSYLLRCWGVVEVVRDVMKDPIFDSGGHFLHLGLKAIDSYCCRNYSVKVPSIVQGKRKEFRGSSIEEVIALAYKGERVGKQIDLFIKEER